MNKGKLIAVRRGGDYLFPVFQFKGSEILPHLDDILLSLPPETDATARVSFLTSPVRVDNKNPVKTPLEILRNNPSDEKIALLRREATLFANQII